MCPLNFLAQMWVILISLLLITTFVKSQTAAQWNITIDPVEPEVHMDKYASIDFNITGPDIREEHLLQIKSDNFDLLDIDKEIVITTDNFQGVFAGEFNATGIFLGKTKISMRINDKGNKTVFSTSFPVKVIREKRVIDTVFTSSVATLVALIYINFGCALNWGEVKKTIKRPIGPVIAFIAQFVLMPLLSYALGLILFPHNTEMQLGMFFTGVSPAGGASNMWTVILGGNINLSITMTSIGTFAAFGMMPLWLFTLGKVIFDKSAIPVPYSQISTYAIALVVPLLIGYLIQRYMKRVGRFMARILKGFASVLLIFIVVFAIVTNLYLFKLFSWEIVVGGLGLPWLGYTLSYVIARYACRQSGKDSLTIAVETGIQNTGIAIFLLRFVLPQPEADLTTIVPVAVAIMTPVPLLILFIIQKIKERLYPTIEEKSILENGDDGIKPYSTISS